jgi:hypothetical protein
MPTGDCERLVDGLLSQPANAVSSLAFVLVGILVPIVVRRRSGGRTALGWSFGLAVIMLGVGSAAFHGPGGALADWVHDASITALLLLVVAVSLGNRASWSDRRLLSGWALAAPAFIFVEGIWPQVGDPLNAPLALVAVLSVFGPQLPMRRFQPAGGSNRQQRGMLVGVTVLAAGALIMLLSRTGGPLCVPDSLVQGHAVWHVLAAGGIGFYAAAASTSHSTSRVPAAHRD